MSGRRIARSGCGAAGRRGDRRGDRGAGAAAGQRRQQQVQPVRLTGSCGKVASTWGRRARRVVRGRDARASERELEFLAAKRLDFRGAAAERRFETAVFSR